MASSKVFLIILLVYVAGYLGHAAILKKTVYGDGIFYYSWIHSYVVDGDIQFQNDYAPFLAAQPVTRTGFPGNKYSIGPAMAWSPWFLWAHTLIRGTGNELPYQLVVGLSGVFYACIGLLLLFRLLRKWFSETVSVASIVATAGATNLLFYGSLDTVNSHAVSFLAVCVFLTLLFQTNRRWFLIGAALGIVGLMRAQDLIVGILILPYIQKKHIASFLSGATLAFLPQLVAWQILYGKFWVSPYINSIEGFQFFTPHVLGVLFSPASGLLLWTPIVALGFYGLWIKNTSVHLKMMAAVLLVELYLVSSWSIWWQGASYSGRMFVGMLPFVAVGLANILTHLHTTRFRVFIAYWTIIFPLSIINLLSIVYFLLKVH